MKPEQEKMKSLINDTVVLLCRNGLTYNSQLKVQGVIAITLDDGEVFSVHINRCFCDSSPSQTDAQSALRDIQQRSSSVSRKPQSANEQLTFSTGLPQDVTDDRKCFESDETLRSTNIQQENCEQTQATTFSANTPSPNSNERYFVCIEKVKTAADNCTHSADTANRTQQIQRQQQPQQSRTTKFQGEVNCDDGCGSRQERSNRVRTDNSAIGNRQQQCNDDSQQQQSTLNSQRLQSTQQPAKKAASFSKIIVTQYMCNECCATFSSYESLTCHQIQCHRKQAVKSRVKSPTQSHHRCC